ncbi:MAG: DUF493 domain-containing protein [Myxococcaceae bacterium]|nr:DUF493 domain-containing protein [Myxococcaceae bacterium]MCI0669519.1 DUF493 domain-containing protein [Myxococcaceae bacterium]
MTKSNVGDGPAGPRGDGPQQVPVLEYPTDYAFKIIGHQEADFVEYVRQLFGRLMGQELPASAISLQPSSKGKYVSVEVRVRLDSEAQRRSIYAQLHGEPRIVLYL